MLEMALRRDVARYVKVVAILAVDSDLENSRLLLMKFGMSLGSEFRPARGSEQQCVSTVVYLFRTMVGMALRRDVADT